MTNEVETEAQTSEESDCGPQSDSALDSCQEEDKKVKKGKIKGYRVKIRNFHFAKKERINYAKRIKGEMDLDTPLCGADLGRTPYAKALFCKR